MWSRRAAWAESRLETSLVLKRLARAGVRGLVLPGRPTRRIGQRRSGNSSRHFHSFGTELERERTRQRTVDGMRKRAEAGHCCGGFRVRLPIRPQPLLGAAGRPRPVPCPTTSTAQIEPVEAQAVLGIFKMYLAGYGLTAIAKTLNGDPAPGEGVGTSSSAGVCPPAPRQRLGLLGAGVAVREILRRPFYAGSLRWGATRRNGTASVRLSPSRPHVVGSARGSPHRGPSNVGCRAGAAQGAGRGVPPAG